MDKTLRQAERLTESASEEARGRLVKEKLRAGEIDHSTTIYIIKLSQTKFLHDADPDGGSLFEDDLSAQDFDNATRWESSETAFTVLQFFLGLAKGRRFKRTAAIIEYEVIFIAKSEVNVLDGLRQKEAAKIQKKIEALTQRMSELPKLGLHELVQDEDEDDEDIEYDDD